ncbi:MAG TPA: uracil-DNA glycosylase family protein [Sulfurovum sp.]|jgi:uracil-DNA glycosylase|nr:MAG: uracil-DNA glycosylase [Sulfurovum sp. 35-42-20]OYZ23232.1 MAG: uracil-DNA glycosylase [Sulfurovum sp. 16-42-52]OYZ50023.1 MAG: uracil-DNA glycosylase [Sulfurovum sp. 24-42-9]OZA42599.1 MAG: uracil-DNA glycosylase [Sulfurovum sp. 17-42-90]OZA61543.1 MAG: uracil-DNA glycosylase [Sulfurovum sp. 39-42-12]HQR72923.1 uracil-DNA glycosylase family protein [Sulfurovum sp.]
MPLADIHASWHPIVSEAYTSLGEGYQTFLSEDSSYFPAKENVLNVFKTLPKQEVKYILFGQDPYPRVQSASGYAFIDKKVQSLFSSTGLSKEVNRATSLRNFIKMALVVRGDLRLEDTSQEAISRLDKTHMIDSIDALRLNFEKNGVLLLNTALIFTDKKSSAQHIRGWRPFMRALLQALEPQKPQLILFGAHAAELKKHLALEHFQSIEMPHPYNQSFITDENAHKVFAPMKLLEK